MSKQEGAEYLIWQGPANIQNNKRTCLVVSRSQRAMKESKYCKYCVVRACVLLWGLPSVNWHFFSHEAPLNANRLSPLPGDKKIHI
ncbi:unnamed protein product [Chondrus crispus]|uniref:Uncharacterized protein n=1 Tax=Chondrus crispus TaxID=2769 RepID=R7QGQ6_CHOCR|nr:unnamed protein product [Chondrus crispus]CDF36933.1 unnamed protein product [Chondrus crispus]|eukprot:XP_005716752.1 unnamed protein product [Chondrus crispus]